jgi:hypothetical protein
MPHKIPDKMDTKILLQLYQSATICDHMGDMHSDILKAFRLAEIEIEVTDEEKWSDYPYRAALTRLGINTVWGTSMEEEEG